MKQIEGTYKSENGKDYYELALNQQNKELLMIKNAGCTAETERMAKEYWQVNTSLYNSTIIKIFFLGDTSEINMNRIPKNIIK